MTRLAALVLAIGVALVLGLAGRGLLYSNASPGDQAVVEVGGAFTLTDQNGHTITDRDLLGRYMLVYFGYTFCPDICPMGLDAMARALELLSPEASTRIQPVFITVDPERDGPERLAEYVQLFHPRLIGLTGTADQIRQVAKAYRVYYAQADGTELYDHSSVIYLMGTDGRFVTNFNHTTPPDSMAAAITSALR